MKFETVYRAGLGVGRVESGPMESRFPSLMPHLLRVTEGTYDRRVAELLAFVSTWTYSDLPTFASVMARRGLLGSDCASLSIENDPLLLSTSAVVAQSEDKDVVIISFRGTELRNTVAWLTDASVRTEPFVSAGYIHGGFHRAVRALWYPLTELLKGLYKKMPLCNQMVSLQGQWVSACGGTIGRRDEDARSSSGDAGGAGSPAASELAADGAADTLRALYITGHSFGGALAVLAAAIIQSEPELTCPSTTCGRRCTTCPGPSSAEALWPARVHLVQIAETSSCSASNGSARPPVLLDRGGAA